MGLSAAYCALRMGLGHVVVYEADEEPGGLAATFEVCGTRLERYHHFLCDTDRVIMAQMSEFGLDHLIQWSDCRMGMFAKDSLYDFTTPGDLLRFDAISLFSRLRFGLSMLSLQQMKRWEPLESISASAWLKRWAGKRCYDVVWSHLMKSKFDGFEDQIPLSWLWARTRRRSGSKRKGSNLEHFGYVKGSVSVLIDEYLKRIAELGGDIRLGCVVDRLSRTKDGEFVVSANGEEHRHHAVVAAVPLPSLLKVADFFSDDYTAKLAAVNYQTVLNMVVVLSRPLSRFFWTNIGDRSLPLPGVIEFSRLRPPEEFDGRSMLYLPNYLLGDHRLNQLSDKELFGEYCQALSKVFSDFRSDMVESWHVFRYPYADPYYTLNYSKLLPGHETPYKRLSIYNTAQIYPITRNVSNSILFGRNAAEMLQKELVGS